MTDLRAIKIIRIARECIMKHLWQLIQLKITFMLIIAAVWFVLLNLADQWSLHLMLQFFHSNTHNLDNTITQQPHAKVIAAYILGGISSYYLIFFFTAIIGHFYIAYQKNAPITLIEAYQKTRFTDPLRLFMIGIYNVIFFSITIAPLIAISSLIMPTGLTTTISPIKIGVVAVCFLLPLVLTAAFAFLSGTCKTGFSAFRYSLKLGWRNYKQLIIPTLIIVILTTLTALPFGYLKTPIINALTVNGDSTNTLTTLIVIGLFYAITSALEVCVVSGPTSYLFMSLKNTMTDNHENTPATKPESEEPIDI